MNKKEKKQPEDITGQKKEWTQPALAILDMTETAIAKTGSALDASLPTI